MVARGLPVTPDEIRRAAERIAPYVHRTPLVRTTTLGAMAGCELWLKAENLQKVGAFKARGAHNAVFALSEAEAARGVITHSSGNHAAALALAARNRGIEAQVVMPADAPTVKQEAVAGYGATITLCEPTLEAREQTVAEIQGRTGAVLVHPYDDVHVIAGQGTAGLEIVDQLGSTPPDVVVVPVGGGGLLSGVALAIKEALPECEVLGAEPTGADDAHRSLVAGRLIPQTDPNTIADGLLTSLGERNFAIITALVDDIMLVDDRQIIEAMELIWTRCKLVVEPSGAVAVAAVLNHRDRFAGRRVVALLTGGNVDLGNLPWDVDQGSDVVG
ncbi:MAG: pyridoxal-phosphate dependent enzyme [Acidimicrobiia bacterium]|nr:pyridoxal-phosphate dependent enzyme [Acidimicrobiia bacterium]